MDLWEGFRAAQRAAKMLNYAASVRAALDRGESVAVACPDAERARRDLSGIIGDEYASRVRYIEPKESAESLGRPRH